MVSPCDAVRRRSRCTGFARSGSARAASSSERFAWWVGVALLADVGWGVGLVGAGLVVAGGQAWRKRLGAKVDQFWVIIGLLFAVVGVSSILGLRVDVVPLLFIAVGVYLLASTWRAHRRAPGRTGADLPAHPRA
jgi:hypothetical protein